jgi:hypothetical protein
MSPSETKVEVRSDLGDCKCIRGAAATRDVSSEEIIFDVPVSGRL